MRWLFLGALFALGCATSGAVSAALEGDLTSLKQRLKDEQRQGQLDQGRVVAIAHAVAAREIHAGAGTAGARRIHALRGCANELLSELRRRSERLDEGGAEATLTLLSVERSAPRDFVERYRDADSPAWRAVAARSTTAPEYFTLRRHYYLDADERVRRAALEAAAVAPASLDLEPLLEAARLDPDPMARSLAVRGVGALGGELAVRALRDLWERAEEDTRLAMLGAFAAKRSFGSGGREALLHAAEVDRGVTAVAAAGELLRVDPSYRDTAIALFARAIHEGDTDEQRLAATLAPLDSPIIVEALRKARDDADPSVEVAVLERLLAVPAERGGALTALRAKAKDAMPAADTARAALARAGDASVLPKLQADLASKDALRREAAGRSLLALHDYAHAAVLLGDGSAEVRVSTACTILAQN